MGTDKGYTGQFQDAVSGFDYYNARYYDPVMGQFLSADMKQGNEQGFDPYTYVAGNPETATDSTGHEAIKCEPGDGCSSGGGTFIQPTPTKCGAGQTMEGVTCVTNNSNQCEAGFVQGKGGCVYTSGPCQGLSLQGCNQQLRQQAEARAKAEEAKRAKQSLLTLWAIRDHNERMAGYILAAVAGLIGVFGTIWLKGNAIGMILAIVANMVPLLIPILIEYFTPIGGSTPRWVSNLAGILYFVAGLANIAGLVIGFFTFGGLLHIVEDDAKNAIAGLSMMVFSFFAGGADATQIDLGEDDEYRYDLQNVWNPDTIIAQCKQQGGAAC